MMTFADNVILMELRPLGLHEAEARECLEYCKRELAQEEYFCNVNRVNYNGNVWELPIQAFTPGGERKNLFRDWIAPWVIRWLAYRYYDALDDIADLKKQLP